MSNLDSDGLEYEVAQEGYAVPDIPHMEHMFDALEDTIAQHEQGVVAGTEGLTLTGAQHYAQGVLMSAGIITSRQITGNEGFFDSLGNGIKAIWEYIVKTFKAIWGFFFKSDAKEQIEEADKQIKENADKLKSVENGSQTEEEVNKQIDKLADTLKLDGKVPTEKEFEEFMGGKPADVKKLPKQEKSRRVKQAATKAATKNQPGKDALAKAVDAAIKVRTAFNSGWGKLNAEEKKAYAVLSKAHNDVTAILDEMDKVDKNVLKIRGEFGEDEHVKVLRKFKEIKNAGVAVYLHNLLSVHMGLLNKAASGYYAVNSKIEAVIKDIESRNDGSDKERDKAEIQALRVLVRNGTRVAKLIELDVENCKKVSNATVKLFGI